MNLEKMSMLSQKIEGVLGTVRTLKEENAKIKRELAAAHATLQDKSLLLETANSNLAECKAALDASVNQANAQSDMLGKREAEVASLNDRVTVLGQQLVEKDGCIESLEAKVRELTSNAELLGGQINEKSELLNAVNAQVIEKDATIASLMTQLNEKNNIIEGLNEQLEAQNEEIAEAQEKFTQLVETIENELGTDIQLDQGENAPAAEDTTEASLENEAEEAVSEDAVAEEVASEEPSAEEPVAEESVEETPVSEPQVDESVSQETEEDIPTIEVHSADENDNDLFASKQEGSQTNFFG